MGKDATFETLLGLTIARVTGLEVDSDDVVLLTECGRTFRMHHYQDCCESVSIADITGDVADLIGSPILRAEESSSDASDDVSESGTWTFYKLATRNGYVDLRWLGTSNGYYSESVSFEEVK